MKNKKIQKGLSGLLCAALLSQSLAATAGAWYWLDGTQNLMDEEREAYYQQWGRPEQQPEQLPAADTFSIQDTAVPFAAEASEVQMVPIADGYTVEEALNAKFGGSTWFYEATINEISSGKVAQGMVEHPTVKGTLAGTKKWTPISSVGENCYWKVKNSSSFIPTYTYYKGSYSAITTHDNSSYTVSPNADGSDAKTVTFVDAYETTITTNAGPFTLPVDGATMEQVKAAIGAVVSCADPNWSPEVAVSGTIALGEQIFTLSCAGDAGHKAAQATVTVTFTNNKETPAITLNENATVGLVWADATTIDTNASLEAAKAAVVLTALDNVTVSGEVKAGSCILTVSRPEDEDYNAYNQTVTVNFVDARETVVNSFPENATVGLTYIDNRTVDYDALEAAIRNLVVSEGIELPGAKVEYYATAKTGSMGNLGKKWVPLTGDKVNGLTYPAMTAGGHQVRLTWGGNAQYAPATVEGTVTVTDRKEAPISFQDGAIVGLTYNDDLTVDYDMLEKDILGLVNNAEGISLTGATLEYYATSKINIGDTINKKDWAPLQGGWVTAVEYPAMGAGTHEVRLTLPASQTYAETKIEGIVKVNGRAEANIVFTAAEVKLPYIEKDGKIVADVDALEQAIRGMFTCETEGVDLGTATLEYNAAKTSLTEVWVSLKGDKANMIDYPAMGAGDHQVRLTWGGNTQYAPTTVQGTVTVTDRAEAVIHFEAEEAKLTYVQNEDGSITVGNMDEFVDTIRSMFTCEDKTVDLSNATLEYFATPKTGTVGDVAKAWGSLKGFEGFGIGDARIQYPAISEGTWKVRLVWGGNTQYAPTTVEGTVTVTGREQVQFTLKDAPYEVGMVFNAEQGYDYDATAKAIYDAVVASNSMDVPYEAMTVEYNTDLTGLTHISYKPLDQADATGLVKFKDGKWEIRISCGDTVDYRGNSVTVEVSVSDNRIASAVVLKEGTSFTYNMDYSVMERAIFDSVIDWENSTLPEGADISAFEIKYKAQMDVLDDSVDADKLGSLIGKIPGLENIGGSIGDIAGSLGENTKAWMPIAGGKNAVGMPYAPMGAGEHQVQITFKGSAEYKPSDPAEAAVTVNKANVKVKVKSDNIRAGEPLPANFITTDPADKFEFYTIYAGATSNVNLGIYIDLPDKYDNNKLIKILDPTVEKIAGKSFSKMLQDGVTLGELRKMVTNTELIGLLEKIGVDTGAFGQIIKVVSALPSITDGVRVGFGIPNRAGLYTVTVITDNKNYNTGVGVGALLVRMHLKGVKLTWNQELGKKISAAEAKDFDFGATLSLDGNVTISQESVHYLYSGFTSKWKPYSSTTKAPTEPGRYTMTVVTLGGNYQAAPITRSFQITK